MAPDPDRSEGGLGLARGRVVLAPHSPEWAAGFRREAARLRGALGAELLAIEHVGSTAVPGLPAKPVLDLMGAVRSLDRARELAPRLAELGYQHRPDARDAERLFFARGPESARTHYLHLCEPGSRYWRETLAFRDHLRTHPDSAREYASLKAALASRHARDRAEYTAGKADFIAGVLRRAIGEPGPADGRPDGPGPLDTP